MTRSWLRLMMRVLVLISPLAASTQQATANRSVNLPRDPSNASPIMAHLAKGDRLTLVDVSADSGFLHVKTEDDQVGWAFSRYITVSKASTSTPTNPSLPSGAQCDANLWSHIYHSTRLIVKTECLEVTGTIVDATAGKKPDGVRHEGDGDTHGWLKVDPQFENLLNDGNLNDEGGYRVFEIVCKFPAGQADAITACHGYTNIVILPPVGSRVRIVGTYVQDTFHAKWMEIHPATSITIIP